MSVSGELIGAREFDAGLEKWVARIEEATKVGSREAGTLVKETGGEDSPRKTGALADSWEAVGFGLYELQVGPTVVYARKVEFNKDYFRKALGESVPGIGAVFERAWLTAQRG